MPKNFFVNVRQQIKIQLLDYINKNPDKPLSELLGIFSFKTGYSIRILEEYVRELRQAKLIKEE